jgi:hypothetical protein
MELLDMRYMHYSMDGQVSAAWTGPGPILLIA